MIKVHAQIPCSDRANDAHLTSAVRLQCQLEYQKQTRFKRAIRSRLVAIDVRSLGRLCENGDAKNAGRKFLLVVLDADLNPHSECFDLGSQLRSSSIYLFSKNQHGELFSTRLRVADVFTQPLGKAAIGRTVMLRSLKTASGIACRHSTRLVAHAGIELLTSSSFLKNPTGLPRQGKQ